MSELGALAGLSDGDTTCFEKLACLLEVPYLSSKLRFGPGVLLFLPEEGAALCLRSFPGKTWVVVMTPPPWLEQGA